MQHFRMKEGKIDGALGADRKGVRGIPAGLRKRKKLYGWHRGGRCNQRRAVQLQDSRRSEGTDRKRKEERDIPSEESIMTAATKKERRREGYRATRG